MASDEHISFLVYGDDVLGEDGHGTIIGGFSDTCEGGGKFSNKSAAEAARERCVKGKAVSC
jgi:hypothetical protein